MVITGTSRSRLAELKKFSRNPNPLDNYKQSSTPLNDGVNTAISTSTNVVYYIGGITYNDFENNTGGTTTIFSFEKGSFNIVDEEFTNYAIYKDPNKENVVSNPKVDSDVFIVRQQLSAFNDNYKLEFIEDLNDLIYYAGGNYFNIVNNT
jgi:hypothetical protein